MAERAGLVEREGGLTLPTPDDDCPTVRRLELRAMQRMGFKPREWEGLTAKERAELIAFEILESRLDAARVRL